MPASMRDWLPADHLAYCVGVPSSRQIAKRLEEDIAFRVLAANNTPDFRTISDFRKDHLKVLSEPVFGRIKQARGFRQFLLRGREKVSGEWQLICTGHNVLKLFGTWREELARREVPTIVASAS